jgi:hypothetical protein
LAASHRVYLHVPRREANVSPEIVCVAAQAAPNLDAVAILPRFTHQQQGSRSISGEQASRDGLNQNSM